ncbi:MAG: hypothetical protein ACRBI6_13005 [Acidimicrobiales bacterium]
MAGFAEPIHLARRFLGSIRPGPPAAADEAWARRHLGDGEIRLWERMSNPDRRHAVGVARAVVAELGDESSTPPVVAAALLHDVGKVVSGYRTPARVVATLVWAAVPVGDRSARAEAWAERPWPWRRMGEYRRHPELGEALLIEAGADPLTSNWAGDHHRPVDRWRVAPEIAAVLKACDDD